MPPTKRHRIEEDFAPLLKGEDGTRYLREVLESEGFSRRAAYLLEIQNQIIQNGKNIFERTPQETLGGLAAGGRRNVQASLVARANERTGGQDPRSLEEPRAEIGDTTFLDWDRKENALREWAVSDGCWYEQADRAMASLHGKHFAKGSEARVYHDSGNRVVKVIGTIGDPQEALDRITITNFLFPETALELIGLGRNEEGEFSIIVRQPFVKGTYIGAGTVDTSIIEGFQQLEGTDDYPLYHTDHYLLGDLHDQNLIRTPQGNIAVIDCNTYLNTPSLGKKGKWTIPELRPVTEPEQNLSSIHKTVSDLLPGTVSKESFIKIYKEKQPEQIRNILSKGRTEGSMPVTMKDGSIREITVQQDTENPGTLLWSDYKKLSSLLRYDSRFNQQQKELLAKGEAVRKGKEEFRFDLDKGRCSPTILQKAISLKQDNRSTKIHL